MIARRFSQRSTALEAPQSGDYLSEWTENSFIALMDWVDGTPLSEWVGLVELYAEELNETLPAIAASIFRLRFGSCHLFISLRWSL